MPLTIHQRLDNLKAELLQQVDPGPAKLADMLIELLGLIEQNRHDLTEAYIVDGKLDQRLCALEAKQSEYKERG